MSVVYLDDVGLTTESFISAASYRRTSGRASSAVNSGDNLHGTYA